MRRIARRWPWLMGVTLSLIAIIFTSARLSNRIFKRLNRLTAIVRETKDNDFLAKFDDSLLAEQDEVGTLALRFRALLGQIDHLAQSEPAQATVRDAGAGQDAAGADSSAFSL